MKSYAIALLAIAAPFLSIKWGWASTAPKDLVMMGDYVNDAFARHPITKTSRTWDLAISGSGFFPLRDNKKGEVVFTRLGRFELDREGYVFLSGHPNLRLLMQVDSRLEPMNLTQWAHLDRYEIAGLKFNETDECGTLQAIYGNGEILNIARVVLAKFFNSGKLVAVSRNIYKADEQALPHLFNAPGENGLGRVVSNALEELN